jgi:hypothetical protein
MPSKKTDGKIHADLRLKKAITGRMRRPVMEK